MFDRVLILMRTTNGYVVRMTAKEARFKIPHTVSYNPSGYNETLYLINAPVVEYLPRASSEQQAMAMVVIDGDDAATYALADAVCERAASGQGDDFLSRTDTIAQRDAAVELLKGWLAKRDSASYVRQSWLDDMASDTRQFLDKMER